MKSFILKVYQKIKQFFFNEQKVLPALTNVGILYICVGKYDIFFTQFYNSFQKKFLPGAQKKYFVFTDSEKLIGQYKANKNIIFISVQKEGWPYDTLLRNRYFVQHFEKFVGMNYLFFCNANLHCNEEVYLNDLGLGTNNKICGVAHPYFFQESPEKFPVEKEIICNAYFKNDEIGRIQHYFQGCFYGGSFNEFKTLVSTINNWTEEDLAKELIPIWHDESYLNRYFFLNKPYLLHSGFSYPDKVNLPFRKKILQLDKKYFGGHSLLRN